MANKRTKEKKPKQSQAKSGQKGGQSTMQEMGDPTPVRKKKK